MLIFDQLKTLGLRESEAKIYLYLLENGLSTPPLVAKGVDIQRTNTYNVLKALKEKGLIEQQTKSKRKAYLARDPEALVFNLEQRKEAAKKLLPDLRALYTIQKNKPKIRFFEGWEEVKEIYLLTLQAKKIIAIGSTLQMSKIDEKFTKYYLKQLAEKKIIFYDILTSASQTTMPQIKNFLGSLHEAKFLPTKYPDLPTDILLWDDNIAIVALHEPIFGTILTNSLLANSFKTIFEVLWEHLNFQAV
jgi:sugar-specific transcriptional regulator TrmB